MGLISNNTPTINQPQQAQPPVEMRAHLEAEEARQRAALAQQQQQMPQQLNTAELAVVCQRLTGYGYGFPTLGGNAAQAFAVLNGQQIAPNSTYNGIPAPSGARRSLHGVQLTEVAHIYQLEGELAKEAAASQPPPVAAPPAVAQPVQQYVPPVPHTSFTPPIHGSPVPAQQITQAYVKAMDAPGLSFLPPDAPPSMPQLAMQHQSAPPPAESSLDRFTQLVQGTAPSAPVEAPRGRGRPKKDKVQDVTPGPIAASAPGAPPSAPSAPATQVAPATTSPIPEASVTAPCVLINARASFPTKSLASYVDYVNAELSKRYCVTADGKPGLQDVRCAPKDSVLAFGGWKGAVREVVKADPPPHGDYHLDTLLDELSEAVADALRVVAEQRGWLYVRGVRV